MTRLEMNKSRGWFKNNPEIKKGLDMFEKYIGRIEWLHSEKKVKLYQGSKYRVINQDGELIYAANNIENIASEFCVSVSRVSNCVNSLTLLKGKYLVERCEEDE